MSGVDLVTFLRARLDERETAAEAGIHAVGCAILEDDPRNSCDCGWSAFVLADVAAKRRIVDEYERAKAFARPRDSDSMVRWAEIEFATKALAAPFAQHPKFDPAWSVEA